MDKQEKELLKQTLEKEFFEGVVNPVLDFVEVAVNPVNYPKIRARVLRRCNDYVRAMNKFLDEIAKD